MARVREYSYEQTIMVPVEHNVIFMALAADTRLHLTFACLTRSVAPKNQRRLLGRTFAIQFTIDTQTLPTVSCLAGV